MIFFFLYSCPRHLVTLPHFLFFLDLGDNEDTQQQADEDRKPEPPKESVDLVGRMLEDDEVPEAIPDDHAPPTVDEDDNVVVNGGDDDEGGDVGVGGDVGDGAQEEKAGGGAKEEKNEEDQVGALETF